MKKKHFTGILILCGLVLLIGISIIILISYSNIMPKNISDQVSTFLKDNIIFLSFSMLLSIIGSIASIIGLIQDSSKYQNKFKHSKIIIRQYSLNHAQFTNRISEFQQLIEKISGNSLINVFGDKGVGKSELLKLISDIINGNISKDFKNEHPNIMEISNLKKVKSLYFDISDKTGYTDIVNELSEKTCSTTSSNINNFMESIKYNFKNIKLIIILDNINNKGSRKDIENVIEFYHGHRPNDVFIIGSIKRFNTFKYTVEDVEILPFKEKEIALLAFKKNKKVSEANLKNLFAISQGLPIFLNFILNNYNNENISDKILLLSMKEYFIETLSGLSDDSLELLKCASFFSISKVELSYNLLRELGYENIENKISELKQYSLVIINPTLNTFKIHDQVSDIIIEYYYKQTEEINSRIAKYYKKYENNREYVLHTLVSDLLIYEYNYVINIINEELEKDNYAFLISVGQLIKKFDRSCYIANQIPDLYNIITYTHLYAIMGIGDYIDAANFVKNFSKMPYSFSSIVNVESQIEFDFHFLWADLDHLQNKYTMAIQNFEILKAKAESLNFVKSIPKCTWGIAHSYRHQGKFLSKAYEYYCACELEARKYNQKKYLIKSLNGKMCINLVWNNMSFNYDEVINEIYAIAGNDETLKDTIYSTKKYQSIYYRKIKRYTDAIVCIKEALSWYESIGKRLIYNLYFELGEYYRDLEDYNDAFKNYGKSLEFANKNLDKNLLTQSRLAILLTEIGANHFYYNKSLECQLEEIISIIEICEDCDLQYNKIQAEIVLLYLKGENTSNYLDYTKYLESNNLIQESNIYKNLSQNTIKHMQLLLL